MDLREEEEKKVKEFLKKHPDMVDICPRARAMTDKTFEKRHEKGKYRKRRTSKWKSQQKKKVDFIASKEFLETTAWKKMRAHVFRTYKSICMCCAAKNTMLTVDHIQCRKHYPELALIFKNLQILCYKCNKDKGNKHETDYRELWYLRGSHDRTFLRSIGLL